MAPSRHDWKIVDWDVKPQHNQPTKIMAKTIYANGNQNGEDQSAHLFGLVNSLIIGCYAGWINLELTQNVYLETELVLV